jgi:hypothetical protein
MIESCVAKIRFARATELAQSKRFLEAEALLSPKGVLTDDPCELDLLARIAAKQEQFGKARHLWEAALLKVPNNEEYTECLQQAQKWERLSNGLDKVVNYGVWVVVALTIAVMVYVFKPLK